jgi:DNA-binding transcriptional ArsR family regulator
MPDLDDIASTFAAAGTPRRLRILAELGSRGRQAGELADALLEPPESVERDLERLRKTGLVEADGDGVYRLTEAADPIRRGAPALFPESTFPDGELD